MDSTQPQAAATAKKVPQGAIGQETGVRRMEPSAAPSQPFDGVRKLSGYGLPCAKCHLYYPADLDVCPTCKNAERVPAVIPTALPKVTQAAAETVPDSTVVDQEREEFLRQFKSQLFAAHSEVAGAAPSVCSMAENHAGGPENAQICKGCYERLQERIDVCEAALHMDMKEAAQLIYDAVWADPSDPSKTYRNAASAILGELRKRAGITTVLGPFQSLTH
jgi:hypothetical protein